MPTAKSLAGQFTLTTNVNPVNGTPNTGIFDPLVGVAARVQLARTYVLAGDKAKAKSAYHDFLNRWDEADSDIPILKQGKAEFAKL